MQTYLVRKRPTGEVVARCENYRDAILTMNLFEVRDIEYERYEPETYYINEVMEG